MTPAVSVIIPCQGRATHLKDTVSSVVAQTYRDWELILAVGGDATEFMKLGRRLVARHAHLRIRLIEHAGSGRSAALNTAVGQAVGRFILPLGAGDQIKPEMLNAAVSLLDARTNLGFVYTDQILLDGGNQVVSPGEFEVSRICRENLVPFCTLYRRELWDRVGGYKTNMRCGLEGWDLFVGAVECGFTGSWLSEALVYQRPMDSNSEEEASAHYAGYKAQIALNHPNLFDVSEVAAARAILAELPPEWSDLRAPMKIGQLLEYLERHPNNRHLLHYLALAQFRDGHIGDAVATLNMILAAHPMDEQARATLDKFGRDILRRPDQLTKKETPQTPRGPESSTIPAPVRSAPRSRATEAFASARWKDAVEACAQVISGSPDDAEILFILAQALAQLGKKDDALRAASHLMKLKPGERQYAALFSSLGGTTTAVAPDSPADLESPSTGRIVALISAYNEGDVIHHVIGDLIANGVDVYFLDNNSTDNTISEASKWLGKGLIKVERFPEDAGYAASCGKEYVWREVLRRKEELATQLGADWYLHADADEFRESPWPNKTLAEAIREVDLLGYNALNFALFNFRPTDNAFVPGSDVRLHLTAFEPGDWFDSVQIKAWKNTGCRVDLVGTGGHSVAFKNRKVFPVNFILRHYPIRSESHGRTKVFRDRIPRFNKQERAAGWHVQYNDYAEGKNTFLYDLSKLVAYDGSAVRAELLGRSSLDLLFLSSMANDSFIHRAPDFEALIAWIGRKLGMEEPLSPAILSKASQIHDSILQTQLFGEKELPLKVDEYLAGLLLALNQVKSAYARLQGNSRMALAAHTLERVLERRRQPSLREGATAQPATSAAPAVAA